MSRDARIELEFAGETRTFRYALGAIEKVHEDASVGPLELFARLSLAVRSMSVGLDTVDGMLLAASCRLGPRDVSSLIYRSLCQGEPQTKPGDLRKLVREHVDERPALEQVGLALKIATAGVAPTAAEEPLGEGEGADAPGPKSSPSLTAD